MATEINKGLDLAEAVRILVSLFPAQHKKCLHWLRTTHPSGLPRATNSTTPPISAGKREMRPNARNANLRKKPGTPSRAANGSGESEATPSKTPPPKPPTFAKEFARAPEEWAGNQPPMELSWQEEEQLREGIAKSAGVGLWSKGYLSGLLTVATDLELDSGSNSSIEIAFPRLRSVSAVLVGLGEKGMPNKRFFEVAVEHLSLIHLQELAKYVLESEVRS